MDSQPKYAPSPPSSSDGLPPIPSITGVPQVAPPLQPTQSLTIQAPQIPGQTPMPQVPAPTLMPATRAPQAVQYQIPQYQAPTGQVMTLQLQPPTPIPGMASIPQTTQLAIQNQKLRIDPYMGKSFIVRGDTKTYYTQLKMMKGSWTSKPKDGGEPGWYFGNYNRQTVEEYVNNVNAGTAKPPPTYPVQTIRWTVFKPEEGMKLKIRIPTGVTDYTVSDVEKEGWMVVKATIFCPRDPTSVHKIVIISGKWQIRGYMLDHTIEPISQD